MAVKEIGMCFNSDMVRAILDGRKTQTRRPIKCDVVDASFDERIIFKGKFFRTDGIYTRGDGSICQPYPLFQLPDFCPFKVGDRIWVRETWRWWDSDLCGCGGDYCTCGVDGQPIYAASVAEGARDELKPWKPSIHMPRKLSRITLEITSVRAERVKEITEEDVLDEGLGDGDTYETHADEYQAVWDAIYAERGLGWAANPWVWVISFCKIDENALR